MTTATEQVVDGEIVEQTALDIRHPAAPATLEQIAALGDGANEIVRARIRVLQTLRRASIQATNPEDWLLFHAVDKRTGQERTIAFLQDCGCDRVASLWGIEVFGIEKPERIMANDGTPNFMYLIRGSGRCSITGQTVEQMEGGRSSSDDFCKDKSGTALELATRKAARANLDGNIVRELTGLKSVPLTELQAAWEGSSKSWERCVKARGYGSAQGQGTVETSKVDTSVPVPNCPVCNGPMWDNRTKKQSPKSPDFKCKDTKCGKAIWEKDDKPKTQAATAAATASGSPDEAAEIKMKRAVIRGKFTKLGWDEKRQDQFCGGRDLSALGLDALTQLNESLDEILAGA
jgi:hypothetical protein